MGADVSSTARRVGGTDGGRRADLAAIHVALKALGWDDDTYRDILWTVCRARSSADLDFAGRRRLLAHLAACQGQLGVTARPAAAGRSKTPWTPQQRLLWARWQRLADAGLVRHRDRPALEAWVARQTGVDRIEWLSGPQLDLVLAGLKRWLARGEEPQLVKGAP